MPYLIHKASGERHFIPDANFAKARASGIYAEPAAETEVSFRTEFGNVVTTTPEQAAEFQQAAGLRAESPEEQEGRARSERLEEERGGTLQTVGTALEEGVSAATFGLSDVALSDNYATRQARLERREANPTAAKAGQIAGAVAPALLSGGAGGLARIAAATPAGLVARGSAAIARKGAGSLIREGAAAGLGYGIEGALFSAGHVVSEAVLTDRELTAEAVVSGMGEGFKWGAVGGAGSVVLGRAAGAIAKKGERFLAKQADEAIEAARAKTLLQEQKSAMRVQEAAQKEAIRQESRAAMEQLKQRGRLDAIDAKGAVQKDLAEIKGSAQQTVAQARKDAAVARAEAQVKAAEARASAARSRSDQVAARIELEQAKQTRQMAVMEARQKLADTYTGGWARAAESRETVAALGRGSAEDAARASLAKSVAKAGSKEAGISIAELVPQRMRSPQAIKAAETDVLLQAQRLGGETDDLIQLAQGVQDPMVMRAVDDAMLARQEAARWLERAQNGVDEIADGAATLSRAESAHHDLAQVLRGHVDPMTAAQLEQRTMGMAEAVGRQGEAVADATLEVARAGKARGALDAVAEADTIAELAGADLINEDDIPVIGPILSGYLKLHAAKAAAGAMGIRVGGPVAQIASKAAGYQNRAATSVARLVAQGGRAAETAIPRLAPALAPTASALSSPLWHGAPAEERKVKKAEDPRSERVANFTARMRELDDVVANPDRARRMIQQQIAAPPAIRDAIADQAVRRFQFLHDKAPKDMTPRTIYPSHWEPSDQELADFSRLVKAVTDPASVLEDIEEGDISPAAVEALKTIHPRLYQEMQNELVDRMAELQDELPYERRVALSLVFDVAADPTMTPDMLVALGEVDAAMKEEQPPTQPMATGSPVNLSESHELGMYRRAGR